MEKYRQNNIFFIYFSLSNLKLNTFVQMYEIKSHPQLTSISNPQFICILKNPLKKYTLRTLFLMEVQLSDIEG